MTHGGSAIPVRTVVAEHKGLLRIKNLFQGAKPVSLGFGVGRHKLLRPGVEKAQALVVIHIPGHHTSSTQRVHTVEKRFQLTLQLRIQGADGILTHCTGNASVHIDLVIHPDHERLLYQPTTQGTLLGKSLA